MVDAGRFFVAGGVLELNREVVAGLKHLSGCLSKASFVAVDGGDGLQAGQVEEGGEEDENGGVEGVGGSGEIVED